MSHDESPFGPDFIPSMKASSIRNASLTCMAHASGKGGKFANPPSSRSIRRKMERDARRAAKKGGAR